MKGNFLLIDPQKNTLLIPADSQYIGDLIKEVSIDNASKHSTKKELFAYITEYLKESNE